MLDEPNLRASVDYRLGGHRHSGNSYVRQSVKTDSKPLLLAKAATMSPTNKPFHSRIDAIEASENGEKSVVVFEGEVGVSSLGQQLRNLICVMTHMRFTAALLLTLLPFNLFGPNAIAQSYSPVSSTKNDQAGSWPVPAQQHRPGVIWWVPGSAMDQANITYNLNQLSSAGFGGVSMVPIYGVRGEESRSLDYLSQEWIKMFEFASQEAKRLEMWLDLTPGTGWKIGGPEVTPEMGEHRVKLTDGKLEAKPSGAKVKRAAPGGAGLAIDPYSVESLEKFLQAFDQKLSQATLDRPNAFYHDSFEYQGNWTPGFLDSFEKEHGYDLTKHATELFGGGQQETASRVQHDYRQTLGAMHYQFVEALKNWAHAQGSQLREQAHGSPGNILDLYALADIPETEVFGANPFAIPGFRREKQFSHQRDDSSPIVNRMASSASHLTGGQLVSSESFTWLREHFNVALSNIKPEMDLLFLTGVNRILYHGTCYSPSQAKWPGWLFYASTEMNSRNSIWRDVPALNQYVTRCQSILQSGRPDNDILLYWPIDDVHSQVRPDPHYFFRVHNHNEWISKTSCGELAKQLTDEGFAYDFISDRFLQSAKVDEGNIVCGDSRYKVLVIPPTNLMSVATLKRIEELIRDGACVEFAAGLPQDVPGLGRLEERREEFAALVAEMQNAFEPPKDEDQLGKNATSSLQQRLIDCGAAAESMTSNGLKSIRRRDNGKIYYFIVNDTADDFDGPVKLSRDASTAIMMDPMTGAVGQASVMPSDSGTLIDFQLTAGESIFIQLQQTESNLEPWPLFENAGDAIPLDGTWEIEFVSGGPELPNPMQLSQLTSWTESSDPEAERFAGTARYRFKMMRPTNPADSTSKDSPGSWLLKLGDVRESARVILNGKPIATLVTNPFECHIDSFVEGRNVLEIEVTNLSANRIRDLDRRKVNWKIFHDINYVDIHYKPFDASQWPTRPSGLLGPVMLQPLKSKR